MKKAHLVRIVRRLESGLRVGRTWNGSNWVDRVCRGPLEECKTLSYEDRVRYLLSQTITYKYTWQSYKLEGVWG